MFESYFFRFSLFSGGYKNIDKFLSQKSGLLYVKKIHLPNLFVPLITFDRTAEFL